MGSIFIDPDNIDGIPQLFLIIVYGYILLNASKLISSGCELLLVVYGPSIVGSLIIPILGAVPDSAVILFSGIGPGSREQIEEQLSVGVGTLAGSTIMLLTLPWGVGCFLGRRDLDEATGTAATYKDEKTGKKMPKSTFFSFSKNVVTVYDEVPPLSKIMMGTAISYFIIQIPAFFYANDSDKGARRESTFALLGFITTMLFFVGYSVYQIKNAHDDEILKAKVRELERETWKKSLRHKFGNVDNSVENVFARYDKDNNGTLSKAELTVALKELGLNADRSELAFMMQTMDINKDDKISLPEFKGVISKWIAQAPSAQRIVSHMPEPPAEALEAKLNIDQKDSAAPNENVAKEEDEDCEEEDDEELGDLTDRQILRKALVLLIGGTGLVTLFSDPMVDTINAFGKTIGVPAFYVSFLITPIASNASEVLSSLIFARKKTNRGITLTLSALYGAASLNNTLCLGIFMSLVYFRELNWNFSAEVIAILTVTYTVGICGLKTTISMWRALLVIMMFPISLIIVYVLEEGFGLN